MSESHSELSLQAQNKHIAHDYIRIVQFTLLDP